MSIQRKRTVILISDRGSNMAALIDAAADPSFPAEIVGVICDNANAQGGCIAASRGISTKVVERSDHDSKNAHDDAIDAALAAFGAEIVTLAGYMRLLTPGLVEKWQGRIINIHPALLPSFKGLDTHSRALDAGIRVHGCTVHFVTAKMDEGPIIAQTAVPVLMNDDEPTLSARVLKAEHRLYPFALKLFAEGKVRMEGVRTVYAGFHDVIGQKEIVAPNPARAEIDLEQLARITP